MGWSGGCEEDEREGIDDEAEVEEDAGVEVGISNGEGGGLPIDVVLLLPVVYFGLGGYGEGRDLRTYS